MGGVYIISISLFFKSKMKNNFNWYGIRSNPEMDKHIENSNKVTKLLRSTQSEEWENVKWEPDTLPPKVQDHVKSTTHDLLDVMWVDTSRNKHLSYPTRKFEADYELEKVDRVREHLGKIEGVLGEIMLNITKANELGIDVRGIPGYFDFGEFYNTHMRLKNPHSIKLTKFYQNIYKFNIWLQKAVLEWKNAALEWQKNQDAFKILDYEREKLYKMRERFEEIKRATEIIHDYLKKANALGINVKQLPRYFDFVDFYGDYIRDKQIDFTQLYQNITNFNRSLQYAVLEWEKMQDRIEDTSSGGNKILIEDDGKEESDSSETNKLDQKWGGWDKRYADDLFYAGSEKGEIVETDEYAIEKLDSMKDKFNFIAKTLGRILSLILDANELGIDVHEFPGYFDFAAFYNRHMKEIEGQEKIDFTELSQNISKFYWVLLRAVHEKQNQPRNEDPFFKIDEYELEKLDSMKDKFNFITMRLGYIQNYLSQAKALGINVHKFPQYFYFTEFYNRHMKEIEGQEKIDFTELRENIPHFCWTLEHAIIWAKNAR